MSGLIEAAVPLVTQARELGIEVPIVGGNGFNSPALMKDAGEAAEGVIVGAAWNSASENPENAAFLEAYEAKYDAAPDQFAAQAYAGMQLIDEAVRAGCSADREAIKENLVEVKDVPTVLGDSARREPRRRPRGGRPGRRGRQVHRPGVTRHLAWPTGRADAARRRSRPAGRRTRRGPLTVGPLCSSCSTGSSSGSIYALFAIGYTLVFGVLDRLNLAHAAVFAAGAFVGIELVDRRRAVHLGGRARSCWSSARCSG